MPAPVFTGRLPDVLPSPALGAAGERKDAAESESELSRPAARPWLDSANDPESESELQPPQFGRPRLRSASMRRAEPPPRRAR